MAFNLLTAAQANPNLSQEFRDQAVAVANQAISVAQAELATASSTAATSTPDVSTPIGGAVLPDATIPVVTEEPQDQSKIVITPSGASNGAYAFTVSVLDAAGKPVKLAPISLTVDGITQKKTTNTQTTKNSGDWRTTFEYIPQGAGSKELVFTSGDLAEKYTLSL